MSVLLLRRSLRRHDRWSEQRLHAHQDRALARLRRHAYRRSAFYRQFHAGAVDRPLRDLPVLTKATLMENFDQIITVPDLRLAELERYLTTLSGDELFRGKYYVSATAGTTGRRGIFVWDFVEWVHVVGSYNRAFDWAGSTAGLTHRIKAAVVSSTNLSHQSARVGSSIHSWWVPTLRLDSGDPMPSLVVRLNEWQPKMLIGYASMVRLLAEEQLAGRLQIAPRFVFSASEVLTDSTRALATRAWDTPVVNVYGATETSGIAAECGRHPGMHLFDDLVLTEIVDDNNQPVPPGVYGAKVLVTVLFSRTVPLIRYELTDSVAPAPPSEGCGLPYAVISGIQGRQQEALQFPTADGGRVTVQPIVFHHVMDPIDAAGWQIVRHPDLLEVLLAQPHDVNTHKLEEDLRRTVIDQGAAPPRVQLREVDAIPRTRLGKAPLIMTAAQ
jgi:phenylacetate-coenzyme A ligase PaaK-like adenylate-forming protein